MSLTYRFGTVPCKKRQKQRMLLWLLITKIQNILVDIKVKGRKLKIHINSYFCCRLPVGFGVLGGKKEVLLTSTMRPSIFASKDFTASPRSELLLLFSPITLSTLSRFVSKDLDDGQILICIAFTVAITYRRLVAARCLLTVHE